MRVAGLLATAALPLLVAGHGSVVHPPPRNAVDSELAPWNGSVPVSPDGMAPGLVPKTRLVSKTRGEGIVRSTV